MEVIPVIDLMGGRVVHARRGDRANYRPIETPLSPSAEPLAVVAGLLACAPFRSLYVADLDAIARTGTHAGVVAEIVERWPSLDVWMDAGVTGQADFDALPEAVSPVIGSESLTHVGWLPTLPRNERQILSLDFRGDDFQGPPAILDDPSAWPDRVVAMTLARVGSGGGPDLDRLRSVLAKAEGRRVYAAGGVRNDADLEALAAIGCAGALVATAIHSGALSAESIGRRLDALM